jgi:hypothetical protein
VAAAPRACRHVRPEVARHTLAAPTRELQLRALQRGATRPDCARVSKG